VGGCYFRTTFHPDYDYATFVGCYKPCPEGKKSKDITYNFVPQVFTKAYVAAWKSWMSDEPKPVALVIEEINRGNCAQIFGQIFQLLDRDKFGFSEYPVTMDQDLQRYLLDPEDPEIKGIPYVKGGKLVLPPNFFIFATMNTSDQSLFPMDSAFKRRWGWEYVPIDCSGKPENWNIKIGNKQYSWKVFLDNINQKILEKLKSPDKQLGERFVKADEGGIIDQKTFVNKIMFYLIGDAFKDDSTIREICKGDSDDKTEIVFADFADETKVKVDGKDQTKGEANLEKFFRSLGVKPILHP
jgi:5-methylcytosine-specific restriction endonuclease McrBC GTP-binding regulatory subunit McrB